MENPKVFISGSRSFKSLKSLSKETIDYLIEKDVDILIGDASGADTLVQKYLANKDYNNVTVYHIGKSPRNKVSDKFKTKQIKVVKELSKSSMALKYAIKDDKMTEDSDYSIAIWDNESQGTLKNIYRALKSDKPVIVINNNQTSRTEYKDIVSFIKDK